jgi:SAM-dependent methyltransferase
VSRLGEYRQKRSRRAILAQMRPFPESVDGSVFMVDLGCGRRKPPGFIGVDKVALPGVDLVCDVGREPIPLEDGCAHVVRAYDFLEHVSDQVFIMNEIYRILRPAGLADIFVPSTDGRGAFQDPTHVSYWNQNSFDYYLAGGAGEVLDYYGIKCRFVAEELRTTRMDRHRACWVVARLRAVKPLRPGG